MKLLILRLLGLLSRSQACKFSIKSEKRWYTSNQVTSLAMHPYPCGYLLQAPIKEISH